MGYYFLNHPSFEKNGYLIRLHLRHGLCKGTQASKLCLFQNIPFILGFKIVLKEYNYLACVLNSNYQMKISMFINKQYVLRYIEDAEVIM